MSKGTNKQGKGYGKKNELNDVFTPVKEKKHVVVTLKSQRGVFTFYIHDNSSIICCGY